MKKTFEDLTRILGALMLALFMVAGLAACTTDTADEPEEEVVTDTTDDDDDLMGDDLEATLAIDDVSTGTELSADGSIDTFNNEDDFSPGDTVYVAMEVGDATAGSNLELVWYGPDGMEAASSSKTIEDDMHYLNFEVDTTGWPTGEYRGEVWYDNELTTEFEINLGDDDGDDDDNNGDDAY